MSEHDHETFESAESGASLVYPQQAGTIRKNGFIVIKNRPCKVCSSWALLGCGAITASSIVRLTQLASCESRSPLSAGTYLQKTTH
jgi:hypothetical protein